MLNFATRRILCAIPTLFGISVILFGVIWLSPGGCQPPYPGGPEPACGYTDAEGNELSFAGSYLTWAERFFVNEALYQLGIPKLERIGTAGLHD